MNVRNKTKPERAVSLLVSIFLLTLVLNGCSTTSSRMAGFDANLLNPAEVAELELPPPVEQSIEVVSWGLGHSNWKVVSERVVQNWGQFSSKITEYLVPVELVPPNCADLFASDLDRLGTDMFDLVEGEWADRDKIGSYLLEGDLYVEDISPVGKEDRSSMLVAALERRGLQVDSTAPDYRVSGYIIPIGMDWAWVPWDVLMAIPSLVLPVPLVGSGTQMIVMRFWDVSSESWGSWRAEEFNVKLTGFSLWGFMSGLGGYKNNLEQAGSEAAVMLIDRELRRLEGQ